MATDAGKSVARLGLVFGLGAAFGAPGYIIGGALGTILFPPDGPEAPDPYSEANFHSAGENIPIALTYGIVKHQGNFVYKGALRYKKVEEGGKGGQKTVVGYKYWTDAAIGICKGPVDVTRMWKDAELYLFENDAAATIHRGLPDETIDPDFDALVDNAVPYRNLCWTMFYNLYLGEDNNTFPTISSETHHFPWATAMDSLSPYVYNKINESTVGGITLKDKFDEFIVASYNSIKVYDKDWTLKRTINISGLGLTQNSIGIQNWCMVLTYVGGTTKINILAKQNGTISQNAIDVWQFAKTAGTLRLPLVSYRPNVTKARIVDNEAVNQIFAATNNAYIFVAYQGSSSPFYLMKLSAGSPGTVLGKYDVTTAHGSMMPARSLAANEDYVFWQNTNAITTIFGFDGTYKDHASVFSGWGNQFRIKAAYGGPHLIGCDFGTSIFGVRKDRISFATYDRATGQFETTTTPILYLDGDWWDASQSPFVSGQMTDFSLDEGPDGSIIISGTNYFTSLSYSLQLIVDANPACIIYHLVTQIRGFDQSRIDVASLELVGQRCFDNRIGMSFRLLQKKNIGAVIRDMLGHVQGQVYRNNAGQFSFFMPSSDDPPEDQITIHDIVVSKNGGAQDMAILQTTHKDIGLCPNRLNVKYCNRLNKYKDDATFQLDDMLAQDQDGEVVEEDLEYQMFSNQAVIAKLAWKAWKIGRYQNRMHEMLLNGRWLWLQPGMVLTLNIPEENLNNVRVRVYAIDDPPLDTDAAVKITFQMDDDYLTSYENIKYEPSLSESTDVGPPVEVSPVIWEEDARYNNDEYTIAMSAIRSSDSTAFCDVYISLDAPDSFVFSGRMTQFANVGDIVEDLTDDGKKIRVNTDAYEASTFPNYTRTNQRNNLSYCLIGKVQDAELELDELEFMTYREAVADGSDLILKHAVRGKDYTLPKAHDTSSVALHVGISYFKRNIPELWIGKKIYVKLVPGNAKGAVLDIGEVATYEHTVRGYTRKATHADRLQIVDVTRGGLQLGTRTRTSDSDVKVIWELTNRNDGMGKSTIGEWDTYTQGDVDDYDAIIYQSDGVTVQAEHLGIGLVTEYIYTNAVNSTDFGGTPSDHFWIGIRPVVRGRGSVKDIMKHEIRRV